MAILIAINLGYIFLTFLPPILWLLFYLRKDRRHPEPKSLIIFTFIGGMVAAFVALIIEFLLLGKEKGLLSSTINLATNAFIFFLVVGLIEEYFKYLPVKFLILKQPAFDEPVDAMVYMITSALGFAALENALFILPLFQENTLSALIITANRFFGANLLHSLASGLMGFFLARAFFSPRRHHFIAMGVVLAALLHAGFNYLILVKETVPQGVFYVVALLVIMTIVISIEFERLKKTKIIS